MRLLLFLLLVTISSPALGEGRCPPGHYPIGGQGVLGCAPIPGAWQPAPNAGTQVNAMEEAAAAAIAANMRAAHVEKIRKDTTRNWWGLVVVSTEKGSWNVKFNDETESEALVDAMKECSGTCTPVLKFANTCLAPAYSEQGGLFWSNGDSKGDARADAVKQCTAAGGTGCQSPAKEAFCSGWKYAYSGRERFVYRLGRESKGQVASPKLTWLPGGKEYIAKPLEQRGTSTAMSRVKIKNEDGSSHDWSGEELDERASGMNRIAEPWIAIATSGGSDAFAMHSGPSEKDAKDTAVKKCGKADCTIVVAAPHGECVAAIRVPQGGGRFASFAAHAASKAAAEEEALTTCIGSGARACPVVLNECFK